MDERSFWEKGKPLWVFFICVGVLVVTILIVARIRTGKW